MVEEERRELIARQHRALYGEGSIDAGRGISPMTFNNYGMSLESKPAESTEGHAGQDSSKPRSRANSTSSPATTQPSFSIFEQTQQQQSSRTSTSSPGGSPSRPVKVSGGTVAPIGTRPTQQGQVINPALSKRASPPLHSPMGFGFASNESSNPNAIDNERSTSAASNPTNGAKEGGNTSSNLTWGSNSGVWGKSALGVQASVWG